MAICDIRRFFIGLEDGPALSPRSISYTKRCQRFFAALLTQPYLEDIVVRVSISTPRFCAQIIVFGKRGFFKVIEVNSESVVLVRSKLSIRLLHPPIVAVLVKDVVLERAVVVSLLVERPLGRRLDRLEEVLVLFEVDLDRLARDNGFRGYRRDSRTAGDSFDRRRR